jgi:3-dehydroquinate synthase
MTSESNIVITGFMGTGKSTVGRLLADRLGRPFLDVDAEIEGLAGATIPEIFSGRGEAGFRALESEVCRDLAARRGAVIATGGGTLVDPDNREKLSTTGVVICLTCDVNEILRRLDGTADRPLLGSPTANDGAARRARIEQLLAERSEAYAALPHHVDTTGRPPASVADAVADLLSEVVLPVAHEGGTYNVRVGHGGLERLGDALRAAGIGRDAAIAIVSNPVVDRHHGGTVADALRASGHRVIRCLVPDGERFKRLATIHHLYDAFLRANLDRTGVVVGLGGGVTTDLAGFAAATFLRGLQLVQVPTSLLAMIDAGVGGKTGVDLPQGKNLIGAFWQPTLVVVDPRTLATLPITEFRCGMAEVIKHALLGDPELFEDLADGPTAPDAWWGAEAIGRLVRAVRVKISIVAEDPTERGQRTTLNLGHTLGHALEALSGCTMRHGEAVAIGLVAASRLAVALGEAKPELVGLVDSVLRRFDLPTRCPPVDVDRILDAMHHDKKRTPAGLRWVLPRGIGETIVRDGVPETAVRRVLIEMGAGG